MFRKLNKLLAGLMLSVVLITTVAHSGHSINSSSDDVSSMEQHDCVLCQQSFDSSSSTVSLAYVALGTFNALKIKSFTTDITISAYIFSFQRAPPLFL